MNVFFKLWVSYFVALAMSAQAWAFTSFSLNDNGQRNQATDIFVIGYAGEVGTQFVAVAMTRAYKILERYPHHRMVFLYALDKNAARDRQVVERIPQVKLRESNSSPLTMNRVIQELSQHRNITSLHLVGHSSAIHGFGLQKDQRFTSDYSRLIGVKRNFAPGAYVYLHGCNTGFTSATSLSEIWELPVLGSLTSTDFQQLHQDGQWYWNNRGQYPARGGWRATNGVSFNAEKPCNTMACHRLKANNHPYSGGWGNYETGLPFFKAFCRFNINNSRAYERCARGVWESILTWPSITSLNKRLNRQDYQEVVKDFLCPKLDGRSIDQTCRNVLDQGVRSGSVPTQKFFWGNQPTCSLQGCSVSTMAGASNLGGNRTSLFTSRDSGNQTLITEYQFYLSLFDRYVR